MNQRDAIIALLPYGLVEGVRRHRMLSRLGAATTWPRAASLAREARLDLLPPGALGRLETVIDVGANEGRWSSAVLAVARPRRLIAIEPSPEIFPILRAKVGSAAGVTIVAAAVGASTGEVQFNVTAHSHSASILSPRSDAMNALYGGGYEVTRQITVPLMTLDEITHGAGSVSLLKLDVQGAERAALEGANETLRRTTYLLIETNFRSHYIGDMLFPELHAHLTTVGFRLIGMSQPFVRSGAALWSDSLYERA